MNDVVVYIPGGEVTLGPKPKLICMRCKKTLRFRNGPHGVYVLECDHIVSPVALKPKKR